MKAFFGWILRLLLLGIAVVVLVGFLARFGDGPTAMFPGGRLRSGDLVEAPGDWRFASDANTVELQLEDPPRSRTTWIVVLDGDAYIPCGFPNTPLKQWPHQVMKDPRVVVRLDGKRYELTATRVNDPDVQRALEDAVGAKYGTMPGESEPDSVWFFKLGPRESRGEASSVPGGADGSGDF